MTRARVRSHLIPSRGNNHCAITTNEVVDAFSINALVHRLYDALVHAYARGFGADMAELVVGNTLLALLCIVTMLSAWVVFRDIASLGMRLIRMLIAAALVLYLAGKCMEAIDVLYPTHESKAHVRDVATSTLSRAIAWVRSSVWSSTV
jgi:hypothetical protein